MRDFDIGEILVCYRERYNLNKYYSFKLNHNYAIDGVGGLAAQFFINPFTGEEYKPINDTESGFKITRFFPVGSDNKIKFRSAYFSTNPKSDVFYGKWFFNDIEYNQWYREHILESFFETESE